MTRWIDRVVEAKNRKLHGEMGFNVDDYAESLSWYKCKVGEEHDILPDVILYNKHGLPKDHILFSLGTSFTRAIRNDNPDEALNLITRIEDRVLTLKREKI